MESNLLAGPILEAICQNLTFPELVQLRIDTRRQNIPCSVPILDGEGNSIILPGVNPETIAMYPYLRDNNLLSAFFAAIQDENLLAVRGFLKYGVSLDIGYNNPGAPEYDNSLNLAADSGNVEMMKLLIEFGGQILPLKSGGYTPIFFAVTLGHPEMTQFLLDLGVSPNYLFIPPPDDDDYFHPYSLLELTIRVLNNHYQNDPENYEEFLQEQRQVLSLLLEAGADSNYYYSEEEYGVTHQNIPLALALKEDEEMMQILLEKGANPNAKNRDESLLHNVIDDYQAGNLKKVIRRITALLDAGVNINELNNQGRSILTSLIDQSKHYRATSRIRNYWQLIQLLLDRGANPNLDFGLHKTLLVPAHIFRSMIMAGGDVNSVYNNKSIISTLSEQREEDSVLFLLKQGANPNVYVDSLSLLSFWINQDRRSIVEIILKAGGNVNGLPNERFKNETITPLELAVFKGSTDLIGLLLEDGADFDRSKLIKQAKQMENEWIIHFLQTL